MSNAAFLQWLVDRLVHVYCEPEDVDFVLRLRKMSLEVAADRYLANQYRSIPHWYLWPLHKYGWLRNWLRNPYIVVPRWWPI